MDLPQPSLLDTVLELSDETEKCTCLGRPNPALALGIVSALRGKESKYAIAVYENESSASAQALKTWRAVNLGAAREGLLSRVPVRP